MNPRQRIIMENLGKKEGVNLALVPMQDGPPTVTAVMGNHIDMGVVGSILVEYTKAGSIKTLAAMGDERMTRLPEVSTLQEQGFDVSYDIPTVLFTKTGVPDAIINRLSEIMEKISQQPEYTKVIIDQLNAEATPPGRKYAVERLHRAYNNVARDVGKPLLS
jgi:tripartite-type tricarboxylate transporter receptor subunit TctC